MNITTRIEVTLERPGGYKTTIVEQVTTHAGDNPSFERREAKRAMVETVGLVMQRFDPEAEPDVFDELPHPAWCTGDHEDGSPCSNHVRRD